MNRMNTEHKKEILFYYESDHANPNGDPGFEDMPRLVQDGTILVTDVRIKRTIRDYAKNVLNQTLFVERKKEGEAIRAIDRVKELGIVGDKDIIRGLLEKTFDVPLFGALVPIPKDTKNNRTKGKNKKSTEYKDSDEKSEDLQESGYAKLTGPIQFGLGKSVNQPEILTPSITSAFQGADTESKLRFSTIGKFSIVDYALIKVHGGINPKNLGDYYNFDEVKKIFQEKESYLFNCLWNGTNELITRSKWRQKSILLIEITYKFSIYNDLDSLITEHGSIKGRGIKKLPIDVNSNSTDDTGRVFNFKNFINVMRKRKENLIQIRMRGSEEIKKDVESLIIDLVESEIAAVEI